MGSITQLRHFDPPARLQLLELHQHLGIRPGAVVHVGGHHGEELETYLACGFHTILYCEPHPRSREVLESHLEHWRRWLGVLGERYGLSPVPRLLVDPRAVSERAGTLAFHLTYQEVCSSLLNVLDPSLQVINHIEVESCRLDDLLADHRLDPQEVTFLNVDAQGAELQVLLGGERLLAVLPMALVEVSLQPRYEGSARPEEVEEFLVGFGLRQHGRRSFDPHYPSADVLYLRS